MRLSTLLSKHLTDAANIQESSSVNYLLTRPKVQGIHDLFGTELAMTI
jgi:hypothetical protein